jgi:hypothetical protein
MPDTSTAQIGLSDGGVVIVRIRNNARQSVPDAQENLASAVAKTAGRRCPLLVDIRTAQPLAADVRQQYTGPTVVNAFTALALLIEASPMGTMMGNVYLRLARLGIPTKLFTSEPEAIQWLDAYPADRSE